MSAGQKNLVSRHNIHPATIKHLSKGHPWVTKDQYSLKFSKKSRFIIGTDSKGKDLALFIHDPKHKNVVARLWSKKYPFHEDIQYFKTNLRDRIETSITRRIEIIDSNERENLYLSFGEADLLPGLFIQLLGDYIIVQYYSGFWEKYLEFITTSLLKTLENETDLKIKFIVAQKRSQSQEEKQKILFKEGRVNYNTQIQEYGVKYLVKFYHNYDLGIYTDMSAIRKKVFKLSKGLLNEKKDRKVLNLYSYTGAYSLYGIKKGYHATSIDLSQNYNTWHEENCKINGFSKDSYDIRTGSVQKEVKKLISEKAKFDLIISDPPSFSSDGKKTTKSIEVYRTLLKDLSEVTNKSGLIVVFINTHSITKNKFKTHIKNIIFDNSLPLKITGELQMEEDCPFLKSFIEGSYIKGLILQKEK